MNDRMIDFWQAVSCFHQAFNQNCMKETFIGLTVLSIHNFAENICNGKRLEYTEMKPGTRPWLQYLLLNFIINAAELGHCRWNIFLSSFWNKFGIHTEELKYDYIIIHVSVSISGVYYIFNPHSIFPSRFKSYLSNKN